MGETRLGLTRAEDNRVLEGLVVFLAERAEGVGISIPLGDMSSKATGTCVHLVNAAAYKPRKAREGMRSKACPVEV